MDEKLNKYFDVLEITPDFTYEEAKSAYRLMVQVWHPDKHTHNQVIYIKATNKLKEINEAWSLVEPYFVQQANNVNVEAMDIHQLLRSFSGLTMKYTLCEEIKTQLSLYFRFKQEFYSWNIALKKDSMTEFLGLLFDSTSSLVGRCTYEGTTKEVAEVNHAEVCKIISAFNSHSSNLSLPVILVGDLVEAALQRAVSDKIVSDYLLYKYIVTSPTGGVKIRVKN